MSKLETDTVGPQSGLSPVGSPKSSGRRSPKSSVFVIWDIEAVNIPSNSSAARTVQSLLRLGARHGAVERFECICRQGALPLPIRRDLQDSGVVVEEIFSEESEAVHVFMVTQLFSIALSLSKIASSPKNSPSNREAVVKSSTSSQSSFTFFSSSSPSASASGSSIPPTEKSYERADEIDTQSAPARSTLILITTNRHFARALGVLRRSNLFSGIILLHSTETPEVLTGAASWAMEWTSFLGLKSDGPQERVKSQEQPDSEPSIAGTISKSPEPAHDKLEKGQLTSQTSASSRAPTGQPYTVFTGNSSNRTSESEPLSFFSLSRPEQSTGYASSLQRPLGEDIFSTDFSSHFGLTSPPRQKTFASPLLTSSAFTPRPGVGLDENSAAESSQSGAWVVPPVFPRLPPSASQPEVPTQYQRAQPTSELQTNETSREIQEFRSFLSRTLNEYQESPELTSPQSPPSPSPQNRRNERGYFFSGNEELSPASKAMALGPIPSLSLPAPAQGANSRKSMSPKPGRPSSRADVDSIGSQSPSRSARNISRTSPTGSGSPSNDMTLSSSLRRKLKMKSLSRIQRHAVILFDKVIDECREEMIIPRESVVRSRIELHLLPKASKKGGKYMKRSWSGSLAGMNNLKVPLRFDKWLQVLEEIGALAIEGIKPQRVLWPVEGRFECADYFQPQERLTSEELQKLVQFFEESRPQGSNDLMVDRGRYGLASYLKIRGPNFIRKMPRGYIVELVQLLLNKHILVFRKGKVSYAPMGMNSMGGSPFSEDKFAVERPPGEGMGPGLPPMIRRSIARLLRANPKFANEVTDDPVGVLSFLCSRAAAPASGTGGKLRRMPLYHFEKSGLLHAPMWVCVITVEVAGLGSQQDLKSQGEKTPPGPVGSSSPKKSAPRSRMLRYKQFETPKKSRKQEAHQEAALAILEDVYWNLSFNVCLDSIARVSKALKDKSRDPGVRIGGAISPPPAMIASQQPDGAAPCAPERSRLTAREVKERETMVEAVLNGSPRDSAQDPALRLDRLLLALDQKPCVYDVAMTKNKNGWNQQTVHTYSVELQLRPRCNIFQFSPSDGKSETSTAGSDWERSFPALTSSPSNSPALNPSTPPSSLRYPPIQRTATSAKPQEAKAEVASHVLQRIRVYQLKYPLLFQIPQPQQPQPHPQAPGSAPVAASTPGSYPRSLTPSSRIAPQRPSSPSSPPFAGHTWNRTTPPFIPRSGMLPTSTPGPASSNPLRHHHPSHLPRS